MKSLRPHLNHHERGSPVAMWLTKYFPKSAKLTGKKFPANEFIEG